jgi:hypothetical protein
MLEHQQRKEEQEKINKDVYQHQLNEH